MQRNNVETKVLEPLLERLAGTPLCARTICWNLGTRGYAGLDGLGCTDLTAHLDTKVVIPPGTTIGRFRLTHPLR